MFKFKYKIFYFILFSCQLSFSQYYDVGYNTDYFSIQNLNFSDTTSSFQEFRLSLDKNVKKVFNKEYQLLEDLVFINQILVSGVEYFVNLEFPFLDIPRNFEIKEVEHDILNYENVQFSESLVKYLPKFNKAVFRVRLYVHNEKHFYILNTGLGNKMYFL